MADCADTLMVDTATEESKSFDSRLQEWMAKARLDLRAKTTGRVVRCPSPDAKQLGVSSDDRIIFYKAFMIGSKICLDWS